MSLMVDLRFGVDSKVAALQGVVGVDLVMKIPMMKKMIVTLVFPILTSPTQLIDDRYPRISDLVSSSSYSGNLSSKPLRFQVGRFQRIVRKFQVNY